MFRWKVFRGQAAVGHQGSRADEKKEHGRRKGTGRSPAAAAPSRGALLLLHHHLLVQEVEISVGLGLGLLRRPGLLRRQGLLLGLGRRSLLLKSHPLHLLMGRALRPALWWGIPTPIAHVLLLLSLSLCHRYHLLLLLLLCLNLRHLMHLGLHLSLGWSLLHLLLLHRRTSLSRHEGLHGIKRLPVTRPCATDL